MSKLTLSDMLCSNGKCSCRVDHEGSFCSDDCEESATIGDYETASSIVAVAYTLSATWHNNTQARRMLTLRKSSTPPDVELEHLPGCDPALHIAVFQFASGGSETVELRTGALREIPFTSARG